MMSPVNQERYGGTKPESTEEYVFIKLLDCAPDFGLHARRGIGQVTELRGQFCNEAGRPKDKQKMEIN
jgi:hypothetical protein